MELAHLVLVKGKDGLSLLMKRGRRSRLSLCTGWTAHTSLPAVSAETAGAGHGLPGAKDWVCSQHLYSSLDKPLDVNCLRYQES